MYTEFYGLTERPFALLPDPRFLYLSGSHREALAHLLYGIQSGEGFIEVVGQVGTGKTTLCRTLLGRISGDAEIAYIFNPSSDATGLLAAIAREFGLDATPRDRGEQVQVLNEFLLEQRGRDRHVLLVIDEAQNLAPDVLEQVRLLSNLETEREKLLQIVLIGQPELEENLSRGDLRQLRQRITVRWDLRPFNRREVAEYVNHRLRVAGLARPDLFTSGALRVLYRASGGVPRMINAIADRALLAGFSLGRTRVSARIVRQSARELPASELGGSRRRLALQVGLGTAVLASAVGVGFVAAGWQGLGAQLDLAVPAPDFDLLEVQPEVPADLAPPTGSLPLMFGTEPAPVLAPAAGIGELNRQLASQTLNATLSAALVPVMEQWGYPIQAAPELQPTLLDSAVQAQAPLRVFRFEAGIDRLRDFDLPAIVELEPSPEQLRYAALLRLGPGDTGHIALGDREFLIRVSDLERLWTGRTFVLWANFESVPTLRPGARGTSVRWLQVKLAELGFLRPGAVTAVFDGPTWKAVRSFQHDYRLTVDGTVGPETLIALYQVLAYEGPSLARVGDAS